MARLDDGRARASSGWRRAALFFGLCVTLAAGIPAMAWAQVDRWEQEAGPAEAPRQQSKESRWSARASLGFTTGPETFLMTLEVPWAINRMVSVGPLFQLGFSDDDTLFAPSLQFYITPRLDGDLEALRPYGHLGMGFVYLENDDRAPGRDEEDVDFLFTTGLGVEYALRDDILMGTGLLFNIVPAGAVGQRFVFGWQLLTFRVRF
jgi:hypothetical protein